MVRQPPQLLSRVLRAVATLGDPKGSSLLEIISQVRLALDSGTNCNDNCSKPTVHNVPIQVRRAVRHAMDQKLLLCRTGRYRLAARSRLLPVDSIELAADLKRRLIKKSKNSTAKNVAKTNAKKKQNKSSVADCKSKRRRRKSKGCKKRRRRSRSCSKKKRRARKKRSKKSKSSSCNSSQDTSKSCSPKSKSPRRSRSESKGKRVDTPMPESATSTEEPQEITRETDYESSRGSLRKKRSRKKHRSPYRPPSKIPSEGPPNVTDEPMDSTPFQYKQSYRPQDHHQQRQNQPHQYQNQHQHHNQNQNQHKREKQEDESKSEIDSLDEDFDRPPSYYN